VFYQAMADVTRGWTLIEQGQPEDALEQMQQGLAALRSTGVEILRPQLLGLLAEALGKVGQPDKGLRVAEEALEVVHQSGERNCEAELYRLKGELFLMNVPAESFFEEAEGCFNESMRIAKEQRAKSWELRTALSLGRLYKHTSRQEKARNLISQVYESFTEGFDTLDLREAKTLLGS
jgi:predicted ATPase